MTLLTRQHETVYVADTGSTDDNHHWQSIDAGVTKVIVGDSDHIDASAADGIDPDRRGDDEQSIIGGLGADVIQGNAQTTPSPPLPVMTP